MIFSAFISLYHEAAICSIASIPSGRNYKHNKTLSQVILIGDLGDKMSSYIYLEQNAIEENVIVSVCAMMMLLRIIHFALRITQDG